MNCLAHVSFETWEKCLYPKVLYSRRELLLGYSLQEYSTLLGIAKFLSKEDSTSLFSHEGSFFST